MIFKFCSQYFVDTFTLQSTKTTWYINILVLVLGPRSSCCVLIALCFRRFLAKSLKTVHQCKRKQATYHYNEQSTALWHAFIYVLWHDPYLHISNVTAIRCTGFRNQEHILLMEVTINQAYAKLICSVCFHIQKNLFSFNKNRNILISANFAQIQNVLAILAYILFEKQKQYFIYTCYVFHCCASAELNLNNQWRANKIKVLTYWIQSRQLFNLLSRYFSIPYKLRGLNIEYFLKNFISCYILYIASAQDSYVFYQNINTKQNSAQASAP